MRSEVSFGGGPSTGTVTFPLDFFAAVNRHDKFEAVACVRRAALQPNGLPSPRVEELGGEWDSSGVGLCVMGEGCCAGSIGTAEDRFCGKPRGKQVIDVFRMNETSQDEYEPFDVNVLAADPILNQQYRAGLDIAAVFSKTVQVQKHCELHKKGAEQIGEAT
jgi:hypothetical protein